MEINIWCSTDESGEWIINNTILKKFKCNIKKLIESDANNPNNFHRMPEAIKRILYLDAVDIIVDVNNKPILAVEISHEAGTGHNSFQRFSRIVAAAENNIPLAYIYPEAAFIHRKTSDRWDRINPNIFRALENVMQIHNIPTLLFFYPSEFNGDYSEFPSLSSSKGLINDDFYLSSPNCNDEEIIDFFNYVNLIVEKVIKNDSNLLVINDRLVSKRRIWMQEQFILKGGLKKDWSPITATLKIPTDYLLNYIRKYSGETYNFGSLLPSRDETIIYMVNAKLRGDPYPGALVALDYLTTRIGENIDDREYNLVLAWCDLEIDEYGDTLIVKDGKTSVNDFMLSVHKVRDNNKCLLSYSNYDDLSHKKFNIPRYYMQVNHSCKFTKKKELRVYSAFADAILFKDGCLWKDG